jgi:uncharacterized protein YndB with AHSA1/START domain
MGFRGMVRRRIYEMAKTQIVAEPGQPVIEMTRRFDAPADLLFRAHTDPDLVARWLGPRQLTTTVDLWELRDGGRWHYINRDTDGSEYRFHGVFHGTPSTDGIVQTFEFEGWPGHVSLNTLRFEPDGDGTLLRSRSVFQTVEARDAMIESGMESGVNEGYERLDELLAEAAVRP